MQYGGRWTSTLNQLRKDTSSPGSYIKFEVQNTTSVFVSLRNTRQPKSASSRPSTVDARQVTIHPSHDHAPPSPPVSLLVSIDRSDGIYFNHTAHGILAISSTLDPQVNHTITLHFLGNHNHNPETLEFEGVWLDKDAYLLSHCPHSSTVSILGYPQNEPQTVSCLQKHFELITDLDVADPASFKSSWPMLLASEHNTTYTLAPTFSRCLTKSCPQPDVLLSDLYFRSGPPGSKHFNTPQHLNDPYPSATVISIGLLDFQTFLGSDPSPQAIQQFANKFADRYRTFVSTIRSTAYPYHSTSDLQSDRGIAIDSSFTYNSAPSTLPIFLMTPFSPSKRLQRLLSRSVAEVVNRLQGAEGDKSTFWIDTSGWLTKDDFLQDDRMSTHTGKATRRRDSASSHVLQNQGMPKLTREAHARIAKYLSYHLCSYLSSSPIPLDPTTTLNTSERSTTPPNHHQDSNTTHPSTHDLLFAKTQSACPFNKHDNYLGHLYIPDEASVGRGLEDRKIQLIRQFLGMEEHIAGQKLQL